MILLHQLALYLHIVVGVVALALFWVPALSKKGSLNHRRFGRWFATIMYTVGWSGVMMATVDLWQPLAMHAPASGATPEAMAVMAGDIRFTAIFLLSLSVLVIATTRHGWLTIRYKEDRSVLRKPVHLGLCLALLGVGGVLLLTGAANDNILMLIFGALEVWIAAGILHYSFKTSPRHPREWWNEHLGGMIASGIGAYTAFFVVGASSLLGTYLQGSLAGLNVVIWVAPGVAGGIAISVLSAKYRRKFARPAQ